MSAVRPAGVPSAPAPVGDEDELQANGLSLYQMNFLAAFGGEWPLERVRTTAVESLRAKRRAAREFHDYTERLRTLGPDDGSAAAAAQRRALARLAGLDAAGLRAAPGGGGVIVCAFHLGAYRYLPTDLMLTGVRVVQPLERTSFRYLSGLNEGMPPAIRDQLQLLDVETGGRAATLGLARALKRGATGVVYLDGNTGADGEWGDQSRTEVRFLGHRIRVKCGAARLAAALGATLLPVATPHHRDGGLAGLVEVGDPIPPPPRGADADAFAAETMQSLYGFLEREVRARPAEWESICFLHRWRIPGAAAGEEPARAAAEVRSRLAAGGRYRVDERFVVDTPTGGEPVWVDVRTLRSLRLSGAAPDLLRALWSPSGAGPGELGLSPDAFETSTGLLAELRARGMVVAC